MWATFARMIRVEDEGVCLLFLRALPIQCSMFKQMLERERGKFAIGLLRTELPAQYDVQE